MKLYSANLSPYASRVRLAIYAKGLDIEIASPPAGGLKSAEYLAVNPMGKMPSLVLDSGEAIPESEVIIEYLEDAFPAHPLRPSDPLQAAHARLLARMADLYVMSAGTPLFGQMNPATRDQIVVDGAFAKLDEALGNLEAFMGEGPYAVGSGFSIADCTLAPTLFFANVFGPAFGKGSVLAGHPRLAAYWPRLQANPHAAKVLGEMGAALAERMAAAAS